MTNRPAFVAIDKFRKTVDSKSSRIKLLNYGPDAIGIRNPVAPCGVVTQDSGLVAMYAGRSRLFASLNGMIAAVADAFGVNANTIYLNPRDIRSLKILGRSIHPGVFNGDQKAVTISKAALSKLASMYVVTKLSRATETGITDIHPLSEFLTALDLFQSDYQCPDISLEKCKTLIAGLGISIGL